MDVEASLPLVDFLSSDSALAMEGPHGIEGFGAIGARTVRQEFPMAALHVRIDFLFHRFDEFGSIWLPHGNPVMECIWV
jgi:hypothetical protein